MHTQDYNNQDNNSEKIRELKRVYERCIETRNFEIQQLLDRNKFFMAMQGALVAAAITKGEHYAIVYFLGLILSLFQIGISSGAKFWQEYWEERLSAIEQELNKTLNKDGFIYLFHMKNEDIVKIVKERLDRSTQGKFSITSCGINCLILRRFSVSGIPIYMAIIAFLFWLLYFLYFYHGKIINFLYCIYICII